MSIVERSSAEIAAVEAHARALKVYPRPRVSGEIVIDGVRFTSSRYNQKGDILSLHIDAERPAHQWWDETPEHHMVRFALDGALQQVCLMNPRYLLERQDVIAVTAREDGPTSRIGRAAVEAQFIDTIWPEEYSRLLGRR
ncbi:hypothetical protein Q5424_02550 [Conexibacter sp. JD483]|uniref:hypothetical protein n=1 Tax=unclassified Conexibacter TaxID=2627773 RepID=UPI002719BBAD|nr:MULTISPECIES: hypothetical protein [unclassified Conexibacter]MDO8184034.1 hypothetical protein [Conexibacter sp. CPCC 205706]MDO8197026.1 hypothetical protein [Conexibacter sp. CPCC 205762]MDR9367942.1 hypothetical protein [Conexibacter sp. JD483]